MATDRLDKTIHHAIVEWIRAGITDKEAYTKAGISESTFYRWLSIGQAVAEGKPHDEMPKTPSAKQARQEFWEEVTRARVEIKARLITESIVVAAFGSKSVMVTEEDYTETRLKKNGDTYDYKRKSQRVTTTENPPDWRAAMEYMARRYPAEWGNKTQIEINLSPDLKRMLPDVLKALEILNMPASEVFQAIINRAAKAQVAK